MSSLPYQTYLLVALLWGGALSCVPPSSSHQPPQGESPPCANGLTECDGTCADTSNDPSHCGDCSVACFAGQSCESGSCVGRGALSPDQLHEALQRKDFLLINVKVPPSGIIPGTDASIPDDQPDRLAEQIGPDLLARVVIYCRTYPKSRQAVAALEARGYRSISYLEGGVAAWVESGYALE